jgi:hypothetical protein
LHPKSISLTHLSLNLEDRELKQEEMDSLELQIENDYLKAIGQPELDSIDEDETTIKDFKTILMEETHLRDGRFHTACQENGL